jgi:hypothetical protein
MTKILVYKTAEGTINECTPVAKSILQKELSKLGKEKFKATVELGLKHDLDKKAHISASTHQKRLQWLAKVKDFDNLTDTEYQDFIHCHTPDDHQYHHWIDQELMPKNRVHRDYWKDIDETGKVVIDTTKIVPPKPQMKLEDLAKTVEEGMAKLQLQANTLDERESKHANKLQSDIATLERAILDSRDAMMAIKGFMMTIPEIKKQLDEVKQQLNKGVEDASS